MNAFLQQQADCVTASLRGFDRLRFRGTLRMLAHAAGMFRFLCYSGHLLKDFGGYALELSRKVRAASLAQAQSSGRPVIHLDSPSVSKEQLATELAAEQNIGRGLIAVYTAVEPCQSYDVQSNRATGLLELVRRYRKCQHLYHYQIHPVFGFMHARLQTWLPFSLTFNLNGREWLSRQMDAAGIGYRRADNCFTAVDDPAAAQELLDRQVRFDFAGELGRLAAEVNPALGSIVGGYDIPYYWSLDQSEWATDILFRSRQDLGRLYPGLIRHGIESFGSKDVMRFLGRRVERGITPRFAGEVVSDMRHRPEGMRLKHRVNLNSVKMYDKAGSVLRVETTLNDVHDLQSPRLQKGRKVWKRMRKGVADIPQRAKVSDAANGRYLDAMAAVQTPQPLKTFSDVLSRPVRWKKQQVRGLNLLGRDDANLLEAVGRGEFVLNGFRNRDLQALLFQPSDDPVEKRRCGGRVTRMLRMLRAHGLIHKLPHTHRYQVSDKGRKVIAAIHAAREADIEKLAKAA